MAFPIEDGLIKTVTIEQVVAPTANHLCYLMLLCESEVEPEQLTQLENLAHTVAKAARNMADAASRVMAESDDDFLRIEMIPLKEFLMLSGQHVLLATQKLSIQPEVTKHREELVEATQNLLLGMVKILLLEDDTTVRNIIEAAHWLLDCLTEIGIATDIPSLLQAFQLYSKAMLLLHNLVVDRLKDLRDHGQRECVKTSMETLKKCISMLHTAMYTTIKHPACEEAQGAKKYILHQIYSTVNDIVITLKSNYTWMSSGSYGYYIERRKRLLRLLSDPDSNLFTDCSFDILIRDLVCFSLAVATCSWREIQSCVTANCKSVLQLWLLISQQMKDRTNKQNSQDYEENLCVSLIKQIHKLDEAVVKSTQYQIMDTYVLTSGSLEQLVNTARYLSESDPECGLDLDSLQPLSIDLIVQMGRMTEVARFISGLATDKMSLESVESSKSCLQHLKNDFIPLLLEFKGDSVQYFGALHKLISFQQRWLEETEHLMNAFCEVINVKDFIQLSVQEMKNDLNCCLETHKDQDYHLLSKHVRFLIGRTSQVIHFVKRHVDKSDDPIYRNGLLVLVKQAENSVAEFRGYASHIFHTDLHEYAFPLLADSVTVAIKNIDILHEGIDGIHHPHLLSPLREGARQAFPNEPDITQRQKLTTDTNTEQYVKVDEKATKLSDAIFEKGHSEPIIAYQDENKELRKTTFIVDSKSVQTPQSIELLPLLCEVVSMTDTKDIEALNTACKGIVELSSCYMQAIKEAAYIIEETDNQVMETIRCELVALTPQLVQTAQETAMSSTKSRDTIYRHGLQFSDLIKNTNKILLPVSGMWYYAIQAMTHDHTPNILDSCIQELTEVMRLCTDTVHIMTLTDIKIMGEGNGSMASLLSKLQKAQTNTKNLTDLLGKKSAQSDEFDGICLLWALSIQILLISIDKSLGTISTNSKGQLNKHHVKPKIFLAATLENSLRIQEAARLSTLTCKGRYKEQLLKEQNEVKTLTEVYLKAAEDNVTVSQANVLMLARTEFLQRQLQFKMKRLSCLLSRVNEEYVTAIRRTISLACSTENGFTEGEASYTKFETTAELLLGHVKTATESVQNCFNFIRDPQVRSSLRFISDHLFFQMSEIISRAKLMAKTHSVFESFDLDIQTQCWSAKAHYLVKEIYKVDGILHLTKEQIKHGLQGKYCSSVLETDVAPSFTPKETRPPKPVVFEKTQPRNLLPVDQKLKMDLLSQQNAGMPVFISAEPTLSYTTLFMKQEKAERWDIDGNQIVKATKEMADKIHHMTLYLKSRGPIQSKDTFVSSAKELVLSCQTITQFVKVIADHCLDKHFANELCIIVEQITTITKQLTIISRGAWCHSSVNAVTPMCKSSDEILVKNAQNLLQTVIQGVRAAETACIKGLKQPEPNSEAEKAASFCFQWKKYLLMQRAQEQMNPETDDLGLRKTSADFSAPTLAPPISVIKGYK